MAEQLCHVGQALIGFGDELGANAVDGLDIHGLTGMLVQYYPDCMHACLLDTTLPPCWFVAIV
jgi:hypothetical protein